MKSIELNVQEVVGLELNQSAIESKVTKGEIYSQNVEIFSQENREMFDAVCSFQVLEHISDPLSFLRASLLCIKSGGLLIVSTPNYEAPMFQKRADPLDLPPHHIAHYTEQVFGQLQGVLGIKLLKVCVQHKKYQMDDMITQSAERSAVFKISNKLASAFFNLSFTYLHEPGHTIMAVFRKL